MKNMTVIVAIVLGLSSFNCLSCSTRNPYGPGTGRFEGFDWARKNNVVSCEGESRSFRNGCEEYLRQVKSCEG